MSCPLVLGLSILCLGSFLPGSAVDIPSLVQKASQGDALAAFQLGNTYSSGAQVKQDCAQAIAWYQKAAEWNNVDALTCLGRCYLNGICAEQNLATSLAYFSKAADKGDADGQNNLAVSYMLGTGIAGDPARAFPLFKNSARQGWSEAQFNMGICYANGLGVAKDLGKARFWFAKGARRGPHGTESPAVAKRARKVLATPKSFKDWGFVRNWRDLGY
ncbi:MAG: tetratricopeptide repeat protein [Holophaga sp.]|nr:tetratricopeptide repeat protein [Holophaga sp.]